MPLMQPVLVLLLGLCMHIGHGFRQGRSSSSDEVTNITSFVELQEKDGAASFSKSRALLNTRSEDDADSTKFDLFKGGFKMGGGFKHKFGGFKGYKHKFGGFKGHKHKFGFGFKGHKHKRWKGHKKHHYGHKKHWHRPGHGHYRPPHGHHGPGHHHGPSHGHYRPPSNSCNTQCGASSWEGYYFNRHIQQLQPQQCGRCRWQVATITGCGFGYEKVIKTGIWKACCRIVDSNPTCMQGAQPGHGMQPGMVPGVGVGMQPGQGMQPGMMPGTGVGMQPGMMPGMEMQPGQAMQPMGMQPGQNVGMQPGMKPPTHGAQPGMGMQPWPN